MTCRGSATPRPFLPAVLAALCLLVGPPAAPAEEPAAAASPGKPATFGSETSVTLVELPVEVVRDGAPVAGLTAADFEVRSGGQALPIVSFEEVTLGAGGAAGPPPPAARRHVFLLFDIAFSRPQRSLLGVAESRRLLAQLDPSDLLAIGAYAPAGELSVLLSFTSDRAAAGRALDALEAALSFREPAAAVAGGDPLRLTGTGAEALLAAAWPIDERNAAREAAQTFGPGPGLWTSTVASSRPIGSRPLGDFLVGNLLGHSSSVQAATVEERLRGHVRGVADTMTQLVAALRGVEGRKALVLLSEGFAGAGLTNMPDGRESPHFGGGATIAVLEETVRELRRAGWVFHGVDLAGTEAAGLTSSEGLFYLAAETGGTLVERTNELAAGILDALEPSRHVYVLHVQPEAVATDGAFHPLDVRVRGARRGTTVRHRDGFHAPLPFRERPAIARLAEAATSVAGGAPRDELGITAAATALRTTAAATRVGVVVEVPGPALLTRTDVPTGLEVYGYALDEAGASSDFFSYAVDLDPRLLGERLGQGGVRFVAALDLPPRPHEIRLLVRERAGGRWSLLLLPVAGPEANAETAVAALFLPAAADPWLVVREPGAGGFELHGRAVAPAVRPSLPASGDAQLLLVGRGLAGAGNALRTRVLDAAGNAATAPVLEVLSLTPGSGGEPDLAIARLRTGGVAAGDYRLEVVLAAGGVARAVTSAPFRVGGAG